MYQVSDSKALVAGHRRLLGRSRTRAKVHSTVVLLGITSLLTDISSEMVSTVLPLYLVYIGGFSPLAFGLIDGIYQGGAAFVGLLSGIIGDRSRRHKEVAATGYGLSAFCKAALALVGTGLSTIGAIVLLDRVGKGIRTAPRDAMISLSTPKDQLGAAFGVHRALDTTGAMLGPLVAFALLSIAPLAFDSLFIISFCIGLTGLAVLVLFVNGRPQVADAAQPERSWSPRAAFGLVAHPRFRALMIAGSALSLATVSDAFIYLALQDQLDLGASLFPLLFVGSSSIYMVLAVPMGRLADKVGRGRVFLCGYALLAATYVLVITGASGWLLLALTLAFLGAYYAATDGVLMAFASESVAEEVRGSGLALLKMSTNAARLVASIAFGALWAVVGMHAAFVCFGIGLAVAALVAVFVLRRTRVHA